MNFTVEREAAGSWQLVADVVEAESAAQAVARACTDDGLYRAGPLGTTGLREHFVVPPWGPPEAVGSLGPAV